VHNVELHNFYSLPFIVRMIKSKRLRWAGHVALMEKVGSADNFGQNTGR